ncbi:hypothetical protein BH09ACT7_BH09ACT7_07810 [soil metagenome]
MSKPAKRDRTTAKPDATTTDDATKAEASTPPAADKPDAATAESDVAEAAPATDAVEPQSTPATPRVQRAASRAARSVVPQPGPTADATAPEALSAVLGTTATTTASAATPAAAGINDLLGSLPDGIQSIVSNIIGVAVTFVAGPPVVPPGSKVTVHSSTLDLADGHTVPADWYYPEGDEPPQRMILLQHGFLGVGAMYSYTAALLAESTNSVVVVPTLSSNRFAEAGSGWAKTRCTARRPTCSSAIATR